MLETNRYDYQLNLKSGNAKARVARMVGREKAVLEVGCAAGAMTRCLVRQLNCRVTGLEINAADAQLASEYCEAIHVGDIEEMNLAALFSDRRFDVVTFADVLEHLRDPVAALRKVRTLLSEHGTVVASIPNVSHAALVFELARGTFDYRRTGLLDDTHIRFFTKKSVLSTFERAGFAVTDIERAVLEPRDTEFDCQPRDDAERELMRLLLDRNPESKTYEFVIKAVPVDTDLGGIALATDLMRRSLDDLQGRLDDETTRRKAAESELAWIARQWPVSWIRSVRRIFFA